MANKLEKLTAFYGLEYGASETGGRGLAEFGGDTPRFLPPSFLKVDLLQSVGGRQEVLTTFMIYMPNKDYSYRVAGPQFLIASICIGDGALILLMY